MKKAFPNPSERLVASALLLLSDPDCPFNFYEDEDDVAAKDPPRSTKKPIVNGKEKKMKNTRSDFRQNKSVSSRRFKIVSIKVVRKRRSKTEVYSKSPPECKMTSSENGVSSSSSCVTATGSCESSIRMRRDEEERDYLRMKKKKKEGYIRRRAEDILGVLESGRCYSEIDIRKFYGDNPTTSKALRLLLMLEEVKRSGAGGPRDPYMYTLASKVR